MVTKRKQGIWERISTTLLDEDSMNLENSETKKTRGVLEEVVKKAKRIRLIVNNQEFYDLRSDETRKDWKNFFNEAKNNVNMEIEIEYRKEVIGLTELLKEVFIIRTLELPGVYNRILSVNYNPDQQV